MYFTKPHQLLDIFTQLEESNLFLIQNCQVCSRGRCLCCVVLCCVVLCCVVLCCVVLTAARCLFLSRMCS
jgi:hypothetical protein